MLEDGTTLRLMRSPRMWSLISDMKNEDYLESVFSTHVELNLQVAE